MISNTNKWIYLFISFVFLIKFFLSFGTIPIAEYNITNIFFFKFMLNFYFLFSFKWEKLIGICNKKCTSVLSSNFTSLNIRCNKIPFMSKFWKKINNPLGLLLKCIVMFFIFWCVQITLHWDDVIICVNQLIAITIFFYSYHRFDSEEAFKQSGTDRDIVVTILKSILPCIGKLCMIIGWIVPHAMKLWGV